ncbi:FGFR1 oncogene partner 2 homolog [Bacillus rossius redtenbacheri]|uniref:FGFR1 oncogene partner 2 homolog n=1 Tax=Bacillus rossius redtenbacheri TaxID=93214 RepID=UPI002FDE50ED
MSLTIQQIILDAKRLAGRLKEQDATADSLLSQTQSVYREIDAMRQYQEEVGELNEAARQRPHSALVAGIQQENRHLRELQQENRELRAALDEHQSALEMIMSKYRQQVGRLVAGSRLDLSAVHGGHYAQVIRDQADKICEMATVMEQAAAIDESRSFSEQELICRLTTENKGLRELLQISCSYGSLRASLLGLACSDKESQTSGAAPDAPDAPDAS